MNGIAMFLGASDIKISDAAVYAIVGFMIVIAVLALLVGIFYLTGFIFQTKALSKDNLFERKNKKQPQAASTAESDGEEDEQTVAAITAAIAVVLASENGGDKPDFVIRRIKRNK